jgi:hypothetical protein
MVEKPFVLLKDVLLIIEQYSFMIDQILGFV